MQQKPSLRRALVLWCGVSLLGTGAAWAQTISFEQVVANLSSTDAQTRYDAVEGLKLAGYPEAAVPLARVVLDAENAIQREAIVASLNLYLVRKVVPRGSKDPLRRPTLVPARVFAEGPDALVAAPVPAELLTALQTAVHDDDAVVGSHALWALGTLGELAVGEDRQRFLTAVAPDLADGTRVQDRARRLAVLQVIGRLYAWQPGDAPVDQRLGDAVVEAVNDSVVAISRAAVLALGGMRYDRAVASLTARVEFYGSQSGAVLPLVALANIGHASSAALFQSRLASGAIGQRVAAVEGLVQVGTPDAAATIRTALSSAKTPALVLARDFAEAALGSGPVAPLVAALAKPALHEAAAGYLGLVATRRAGDVAEALAAARPRDRVTLLSALGYAADRRTAGAVEAYARDADAMVAQAAARAVARIGAGTSGVAR